VPSGVPSTQSRMWSMMALAAERAELTPDLAFITAAPRCWMVEINSPWSQVLSRTLGTGWPAMVA